MSLPPRTVAARTIKRKREKEALRSARAACEDREARDLLLPAWVGDHGAALAVWLVRQIFCLRAFVARRKTGATGLRTQNDDDVLVAARELLRDAVRDLVAICRARRERDWSAATALYSLARRAAADQPLRLPARASPQWASACERACAVLRALHHLAPAPAERVRSRSTAIQTGGVDRRWTPWGYVPRELRREITAIDEDPEGERMALENAASDTVNIPPPQIGLNQFIKSTGNRELRHPGDFEDSSLLHTPPPLHVAGIRGASRDAIPPGKSTVFPNVAVRSPAAFHPPRTSIALSAPHTDRHPDEDEDDIGANAVGRMLPVPPVDQYLHPDDDDLPVNWIDPPGELYDESLDAQARALIEKLTNAKLSRDQSRQLERELDDDLNGPTSRGSLLSDPRFIQELLQKYGRKLDEIQKSSRASRKNDITLSAPHSDRRHSAEDDDDANAVGRMLPLPPEQQYLHRLRALNDKARTLLSASRTLPPNVVHRDLQQIRDLDEDLRSPALLPAPSSFVIDALNRMEEIVTSLGRKNGITLSAPARVEGTTDIGRRIDRLESILSSFDTNTPGIVVRPPPAARPTPRTSTASSAPHSDRHLDVDEIQASPLARLLLPLLPATSHRRRRRPDDGGPFVSVRGPTSGSRAVRVSAPSDRAERRDELHASRGDSDPVATRVRAPPRVSVRSPGSREVRLSAPPSHHHGKHGEIYDDAEEDAIPRNSITLSAPHSNRPSDMDQRRVGLASGSVSPFRPFHHDQDVYYNARGDGDAFRTNGRGDYSAPSRVDVNVPPRVSVNSPGSRAVRLSAPPSHRDADHVRTLSVEAVVCGYRVGYAVRPIQRSACRAKCDLESFFSRNLQSFLERVANSAAGRAACTAGGVCQKFLRDAYLLAHALLALRYSSDVLRYVQGVVKGPRGGDPRCTFNLYDVLQHGLVPFVSVTGSAAEHACAHAVRVTAPPRSYVRVDVPAEGAPPQTQRQTPTPRPRPRHATAAPSSDAPMISIFVPPEKKAAVAKKVTEDARRFARRVSRLLAATAAPKSGRKLAQLIRAAPRTLQNAYVQMRRAGESPAKARSTRPTFRFPELSHAWDVDTENAETADWERQLSDAVHVVPAEDVLRTTQRIISAPPLPAHVDADGRETEEDAARDLAQTTERALRIVDDTTPSSAATSGRRERSAREKAERLQPRQRHAVLTYVLALHAARAALSPTGGVANDASASASASAPDAALAGTEQEARRALLAYVALDVAAHHAHSPRASSCDDDDAHIRALSARALASFSITSQEDVDVVAKTAAAVACGDAAPRSGRPQRRLTVR